MANRIGITDFVKSHFAGRVNASISYASNSAVKNISGLNTEGDNSSLASRFNLGGGKYGTNFLAYPFDVDYDPGQGHYIMFNVKEVSAAKLKQNKARKEYREIIRNLEKERNSIGTKAITAAEDFDDFGVGEVGQFGYTQSENKLYDLKSQQIAGATEKLGDISNAGGKLNRSIQLAMRPTVRTNTAIALYMPPSVQVSYDVKYNGDEKIGSLAQVGLAAIEAFRSDGSTTTKLNNLKSAIGSTSTEGFKNILNSTLDTLAPGARALQQIESGKVITPRMELMFEGVGRRSFNYTFVFIPKSEGEAKMVERIVQAFKENMMPEYTNDTTRREMKIPNTFDITYMYQNAANGFLNKISECFLTKADVQYGADRFTAYESTKGIHGEGPPAQKTTLTLSFTELEVLSKEHVKQGF